MADRELFAWPGAAIMGDEGCPSYARVDPEFVGSPVWGVNGAIAALLARVAEVEAERDAVAGCIRRLREIQYDDSAYSETLDELMEMGGPLDAAVREPREESRDGDMD